MKHLQCKCFSHFRHLRFNVQSDLPWLLVRVLEPLAVALPRARQPPRTEAQRALGLCSCQQDPAAYGGQVCDKESRIWEKEGQ